MIYKLNWKMLIPACINVHDVAAKACKMNGNLHTGQVKLQLSYYTITIHTLSLCRNILMLQVKIMPKYCSFVTIQIPVRSQICG